MFTTEVSWINKMKKRKSCKKDVTGYFIAWRNNNKATDKAKEILIHVWLTNTLPVQQQFISGAMQSGEREKKNISV